MGLKDYSCFCVKSLFVFVSAKESFGVLGLWDCQKFCLWL